MHYYCTALDLHDAVHVDYEPHTKSRYDQRENMRNNLSTFLPAAISSYFFLIFFFAFLHNVTLGAVIVSAVIKNVVMPKKLLQLKGMDFLVGIITAFTTAITSPTLGFGCGVILYIVISLSLKKKVVGAKIKN